MEDAKIKSILLDENYVSAEDIKKAEDVARAHKESLVDVLLSSGLITRGLLGQAVAESYKIPYFDLASRPPTREQVVRIPEALARKLRVVLLQEDDKSAVFTTDSPHKLDEYAELSALFSGKKLGLNYSSPEDLEACFIHYRRQLQTRFSEIIKSNKRVAPEIIDQIFEDALAVRGSDIHMEPQAGEVIVRFRIDGVLQEAGRIPKEFYENIVNRIKVQARLRIDEHATPQDGAIRHEAAGRPVDMRISIVPTLDGEKIVIRLLSLYLKDLALSELGLSDRDQDLIKQASHKPFGMILVTGPTGSGKTTTLYAVLNALNTPNVNITTIEDPVEYKIPGINQIQVNPQAGLTFATGLRSIVRQDPNVILVGEIRDPETAEIAVNAALTGHLMLSTFHANDAATAIPRLLEMEIEPFLLASTLELIVAKRLVRKICESCRYSQSVPVSQLATILPSAAAYFKSTSVILYRGKGCPACNGTGFKGRTGIHECIVMTPEMRELVTKQPSALAITKLARSQGSRSLFEDGIEKVKNGVTTLEELLRVAAPPAAQTYVAG